MNDFRGEFPQPQTPYPFQDERGKLQEAFLQREPEIAGIESWKSHHGDYSLRAPHKPIERNGVILEGLDAIIAEQIEQALSHMESDQYPFVALDLGGMFGMSWLRLAKSFKEEITQGKVMFVVSNLRLDISNIDDPTELKNPYSSRNEPIFFFSEGEKSLYRDNKHLISYVLCSSDTITQVLGCAPNLIIDTRSASAHSWVPEITREQILDSLAPKGVVYWDVDLEIPNSSAPDDIFRAREISNIRYLSTLPSSPKYQVIHFENSGISSVRKKH